MSIREKALSLAVQYAVGRPEPTGIAGIVDYAKGFELYLEGQADQVISAPKTVAKIDTQVLPKSEPSKPLKEAKPAKVAPAKAAPAKPIKTEEELADEVLAEQKKYEDEQDAAAKAERFAEVEESDVKDAIADMLKASKRKELLEIFGRFGAKSFSGLAQKDWAAFYAATSDIIISS